MSDEIRQRVLKVLKQDAYQYREQPFQLKSGRMSNHYVDVRRALLMPEPLREASLLMGLAMDNLGGFEGLAAVMSGGVGMATVMSQMMNMPMFWVRPDVKDHGTQRRVEMPHDYFSRRLSSHGVVLIEDVMTTGGSIVSAAKALTQEGLTIAGVVVLVDREEGGASRMEGAGLNYASVFTLSDLRETYPPGHVSGI